MADDLLPPGFMFVDDEAAAALPPGFTFAEEPKKPMNRAADMALSLGSGMVRGATETAMFPATAARMLQTGTEYAAEGIDDTLRSIFGFDAVSPEQRAADRQKLEDGTFNIMQYVNPVTDDIRAKRDSLLHEPETTAGEYARTIGEFAVPGGLPSRAARMAPGIARKAGEYGADLLGNAVLPGALSETAGQITEGTDYETAARVAGGLAGNIGTAAGRAYNAPESVVRRATGDVSPGQWDEAVRLQNNITGVRLTGPEAIAQATGGASALPNVQRVVEGSVDGRAATAPFFAQRPAQVDAAVGNLLDAVGPQSAQPSVLGPRAAEAAGAVVDNVRRDVNRQTRPLYEAAETQLVPDADFVALSTNPSFALALERARADPEIGPTLANLPDNSPIVIDAVTKDLFARGEAMATKANPLYGPAKGSLNSAAGAEARDLASNNSDAYAQALAEQTRLRRDVLEPVSEGPVGRVARATETAGAGNALLPQNPLTGSADETADAVARLVQQDEPTTRGLVRQTLADRFAKANTETQEGVREFAGAKFRQAIAGNPTREEVLDAIFGALPGQQAQGVAADLLPVLEATGRRKQIGSATEFNRGISAELSDASIPNRAFGLARTLGASFVTNAGDATRRVGLRNNLGTLAEVFTDPQSVELIRNAILRGAPAALPQAFARSGVQSTSALYGDQ